MYIKNWNIEEMTGYHPITTFYTDFSIAEIEGERGIKDTFRRVLEEWCNDYRYLTEFVMVLNWKMWEHSENNLNLCKLYERLWNEASRYAEKNLKSEELKYYYRTID